MTDKEEDVLVEIVAAWNSAVGAKLRQAFDERRNALYYEARHNNTMQLNLTQILGKVQEQLNKNPTVAEDLVQRAMKLVSMPK